MMPRRKAVRLAKTALTGALLLMFVAGCHRKPPAPQATHSDVEATQQEARHEVDQARIEASKDVKSALKTMGADSKNVVAAKLTGAYDIAMAQADGDHKVALEKCLALPPQQQQSCTAQADLDYATAKTNAKASRASRPQ
jgi:hypothetical protein